MRRLFRFRIPLQQTVRIGRHELSHRQGLWLCEQQFGRWHIGEAAPLEGFSNESLAEIQPQAMAWLTDSPFQPEQFASLDMAMHMLAQPIELLDQVTDESFTMPKPASLLWHTDMEQLKFQMAFLSEGQSVKWKIGRKPFAEELGWWQHAHQLRPDLHWRLDANQTLSVSQCQHFYAHKPAGLRLDYFEQPCATLAELNILAQHGIPIAADESLHRNWPAHLDPHRLQLLQTLRAWVYKPTVMGVTPLPEWAKLAAEAGVDIVFSSSFETGSTLDYIARLSQQFSPNIAPGLDTRRWLPEQLPLPWQDTSHDKHRIWTELTP